ncbi:hypothetical protein C8Q77DRAFT_1051096 [Trametes polyzona]|nr:hypothetical protein C8Q77DRAFT_1051096 [Trametes polyzona]
MVDEPPAKKPDKRKQPVEEDSDEVVALVGPPRGKKAAARAEPHSNGKSAAAKGKARADPPPKAAKPNGTPAEVVEESDGIAATGDGDEPSGPPPQRAVRGASKQPKAKNGTIVPPPARPSKADAKLAREIENLRAQLEQSRQATNEITAQRDKLAKQLEEVFRVRNTSPEEALQEYKSQFEDTIQKKDALIEQLTAQLSKLHSSSKPDKTYTLHFLTREAAEEEKLALREENNRLKEAIKQREATIASKEKQIQEVNEEVKVTKKELEAEIQRSKTLAARAPPPAAARMQKPAVGEAQNVPVIRLYEDLTNILVTGVRVDKSPEFPDIDENIINCIYTYQSAETGQRFALSFTLRDTYERPPDAPPGASLQKDELVRKVKYEPSNLDKEPPEIVESLNFFRGPFMFTRDQMTVFLRQLADTFLGIFEPDVEADNSAEVIVVDG